MPMENNKHAKYLIGFDELYCDKLFDLKDPDLKLGYGYRLMDKYKKDFEKTVKQVNGKLHRYFNSFPIASIEISEKYSKFFEEKPYVRAVELDKPVNLPFVTRPIGFLKF